KLRQETRRELERRFAADPMPEPPELVREMVGAFAGGEMAGYLETRAATVVSLVAEAAEAAAAEKASFAFLGLSGAVKGYATGRPQGRQAAELYWQLGIDGVGVDAACGQLVALGTAND